MESFSRRNPSDDLAQTLGIISNSLVNLQSMEQTENVKAGIDNLEQRYFKLLKAIDILEVNGL